METLKNMNQFFWEKFKNIFKTAISPITGIIIIIFLKYRVIRKECNMYEYEKDFINF